MHIAIDARIINSTTGQYVERLITHLQTIDTVNDYSILVPTKDRDFWVPTNPKFTVRTVDFDNYSLAEQFGFKKYLNQLKPDLVHFCMPQQPVWYKGKTITTFHDLNLLKTWNSDKNWLIYHIKQFVGRWVFYKVAHKSNLIIVPTDYTAKELIKYCRVSADKIRRTYESADLNLQDIEPYPSPFTRFILYVGQQPDYKNIRRLAEAHQQLLGKYPDLGLILAGRKKADSISNESYFKSKNYKNIIYTDFVSNGQRDWLYQNCTVYAFPSLMEGFGLPGLEAMAYGAPVASSNATCLPEVYGDAAAYFKPNDVTDIAKTLDSILSDENLRTDLINKGRQQVSKYSWERMANETHAAYLEILN